MKRTALFLSLIASLLSLAACSKVDLSGVESRLSKLESEYSQLSSAVNALQQAKDDGDYITAVTPVVENNVVVGYTIKFRKADPITIYNGKDGKDGKDGADGKDGVDGKDGKDGEDGKDGVDGKDGKDGENGKDGVDGKDGADGKDGGIPNVTISYTATSIVFTFADGTVIEIPFSSSDFIKSIVSVTFVPEFYDGLPTMYYGKDSKHASLRYVISPSSVAGTLTKDKVKVNAVYTQTRASIDNIALAVTAFSADAATGVVDLTIDGSALSNEYYSGKVFASISLQISDGTAAYNTDYLRIVAKNEGSGPDTPEPVVPSSVLSDSGTANCYIAPAGKSYSFYAMTKGNGSESVGTPTKAELLWETQCGADALEKNCVVKDVVFDVGYVYFTAVADGNAVIAVKDAGGNILWSWHIWVTDYNPNNEYDTWCIGVKMMNRNLGALSKKPEDRALTYGLLYQWGRKDPFVAATNYSSSMATTYPPFVATYNPTDEKVGTVGYSIANPTVFIIDTAEPIDWQYSRNEKLWGDQKTQYDPCPPGWKVPEKTAWEGWPNALGYNTGLYSLFNLSNFGVNIGTQYSSPATWCPLSGYRSYSTGLIEIYNCSYCWTTTYSYSYSYYIRDSYYLGLYMTNIKAALGCTVRCQKEE